MVPGLIPAHAGKTSSALRPNPLTGAHPRSRGENAASSCTACIGRGSSPLTRGKLNAWHPSHHCWGLIPAHAGKTHFVRPGRGRRAAHPRSRGENLLRGDHRRDVRGLIPAHAGKTLLRLSRRRAARAHPRSRGENLQLRGLHDLHTGSSPLTRGKRLGGRRGAGTGGLIPAHAGKTASPASGLAARRAHPRSRGENSPVRSGLVAGLGSSPLTRGKRAPAPPSSSSTGLIPAHAGKTAPGRGASAGPRAHPRSRGENPSDSAGV